MGKNVLVIGATSAIAEATARILAAEGARFFLVGRSREKLQGVQQDLVVRGAKEAEIEVCDLIDMSRHVSVLEKAIGFLKQFDLVLIAHGYLGDQKKAEESFVEAKLIIDANFVSYVSLLTVLANQMQKQSRGCLAIISSVAGDRGRKSNYVYGSSKGALNLFLEGLRGRLYQQGVKVLTVKPGWVDTPMIAHLKKGKLTVQPDVVARGIVRSIGSGKDVVYLPPIWRWIMLVIRSIPEVLFKRMAI